MRTMAARVRVPASVDWRVGGLIALALAAFWPSCQALWDYWTNDLGFGGHGVLIAGLSLWLLWRSRERVAAAPVHPEPWSLLPLVLSSLASLIFWKASIEELQLLMLPALMLLAVLSACGREVARTLAVPLGFLYFAMPAWNMLAWPLQSLTLWFVRLAAPLMGMPTAVFGASIALPGDMRFNVGLACSGAGFLAQGLAVAALVGELELAPLGRRLRLLGSMAVVALIANWVRVLAIVYVGYTTGMRHVLVTRHHLLFGYVLFVLVLTGFVWLARARAAPAAQRTAAPPPSEPDSRAAVAYISTVLALAGPPALAAALAAGSEPVAVRELRLPSPDSPWSGPLPSSDDLWRPVFVGTHDERRGVYRDLSGHTVEAVAIGYNAQAQDRELVNENNSLAGNGGFAVLSSTRVEGAGQLYREEVVVDKAAQRSVIWSFYVIGGRRFVTSLWAQLWYGINAFRTPPYSALLGLRSACTPSCPAAREVLSDFMRGGRLQPSTAASFAGGDRADAR